MDIRIRDAEISDLGAMQGLLQALFAIESDFEPSPERQAAGLRALVAAETSIVLVADNGGLVVGMVTAQCLMSTAEGGPVGLVEDMVIDEGHRGSGLGAVLLSALEKRASAQGWTRLQLLVDIDNAPAVRFYDRCGWSPTRLAARRRSLKSPPL